MLDIRMLFSTLVDADFLATEAHFERDASGAKRFRPVGPKLDPAAALDLTLRKARQLSEDAHAADDVMAVRQNLLAASLSAAEQAPGVFTLTAPTGSGKTMAMLAFALRHAHLHGLQRVVVVIPYLGIVEQTAAVYRSIFEPVYGPLHVIEHHSLAVAPHGPGLDTCERRSLSRLLAENWDAPVILTTSVQALESLFANRPFACRKLHRLARSVLLFDEVQTLPANLAVPTLAMLSHLSARYGSTVVFATATQPAFSHLDAPVRSLAGRGWQPREIAAPELRLFDRTRRTTVEWSPTGLRTAWPDLADELADHEQALCVVNLKRHAVALVKALQILEQRGLFHISTNLCPKHRGEVLAEVRARLSAGRRCLLVATQCVEAGVDLDFPVVYRSFGPLEAIAQAAGRCNRNGRLAHPGRVRVFRPLIPAGEVEFPDAPYRQAAEVTEELLARAAGAGIDIDDPESYRRYYERLYDLTRPHLNTQRARDLDQALQARNFAEVGRLYRIIPQDAISVVVPFDHRAWESLGHEARATALPSGSWIRMARQHAVNLFRPRPDSREYAQKVAYLEPLFDDDISTAEWCLYLNENGYDPVLGLKEEDQHWIA